MNRKPPIHCTPCRVTYQGVRYQIERDGTVYPLAYMYDPNSSGERAITGYVKDDFPACESDAKLVRREASRQRCNRNARERYRRLNNEPFAD